MSNQRGSSDHTLLIFALAVFLFNSPINIWWSAARLPWYAIFAPWILIVVLLMWNQIRQDYGD